MSGSHGKFVLILLATLLCLRTVNLAYAAQRHSAGKPPVKQEQPTPAPEPAPVLAPLNLEQMPSSPPQVTFLNGRLTIAAQNSTLGDILRAVRKQTGAAVEIPANATERVVGQFGPGLARDVLASLLNGSHFNYVMLGSATNPDLVERVILISKPGSGPESGSQSPANAVANPPVFAQPQVQPPGSFATAQGTDDMTSDDAAEDAGETDNQADNQANQPDEQQQQNGQPAIKTPEQLLQELQRQQQIQQQQQQAAPQGFPAPPGQPIQPQPTQPQPTQPQPTQPPPQ